MVDRGKASFNKKGCIMKKTYIILIVIALCMIPTFACAEKEKIPVEDDKLAIENRAPEKLLPAVAYRYNEKIPYDVFGRYWGLGFKMQDSFDNSNFYWTGSGDGLDSEGYLLWLIRQCFGYSPDEIKGGLQIKRMKEVTFSSLKEGDIAVKDGDTGKVYGIVVCFQDDRPIFSVCDSQKTKKFVCGCSHFCYGRDEDGFFDGYRPVRFEKFYRMSTDWGKS